MLYLKINRQIETEGILILQLPRVKKRNRGGSLFYSYPEEGKAISKAQATSVFTPIYSIIL